MLSTAVEIANTFFLKSEITFAKDSAASKYNIHFEWKQRMHEVNVYSENTNESGEHGAYKTFSLFESFLKIWENFEVNQESNKNFDLERDERGTKSTFKNGKRKWQTCVVRDVQGITVRSQARMHNNKFTGPLGYCHYL